MKIKLLFTFFLIGWAFSSNSQNTTYYLKENLPYYPETIQKTDPYITERCVLDIYYPQDSTGFATMVWFHGGGLTGGEKEIPEGLREKGIAVIGVNYRLSPKVNAPAYIEDAAAAVSWVFNNIINYGGDSTLIFVSGHSAGGYLAAMIGLDKNWLAKYAIDANRIAGLMPLSGHAITHFTVRSERGLTRNQPVIDSLAPLYHVRKDAPPLLLITGDRDLDIPSRYEENAYLCKMMEITGHDQTLLYELDGYNHGMVGPALPLVLKEIRRIIRERVIITD